MCERDQNPQGSGDLSVSKVVPNKARRDFRVKSIIKLRRRFYGKRRSSPINLEEILGGNSAGGSTVMRG